MSDHQSSGAGPPLRRKTPSPPKAWARANQGAPPAASSEPQDALSSVERGSSGAPPAAVHLPRPRTLSDTKLDAAGRALPIIRIYTDGSCIGNPGPGGWAYVTSVGDKIQSDFGHCCARTTNVEMELIAVVQALRNLERVDLSVTVYIDLEYISNCMNVWLPTWEKNGWRTNKGKPVAHRRVLEDLKALRDARGPGAEITFAWIKGHAGHPGNEEADRLAQAAAAMASRSRLSCRTRYDAETGLMVPE